jgi:hypothetical protein
MAILAAHRVGALLTGHIHSFFEDRTGVVLVVVLGRAGSERDAPGKCQHYLVCTVEADGSLSVRRRDMRPVPGDTP